eukprot:6205261-Pleurochrysis_carterae.AAC.5
MGAAASNRLAQSIRTLRIGQGVHVNSFNSGSSGISAHMQQQINVLLLQHQARLERDGIVCSTLRLLRPFSIAYQT